MDRFPRYTTAKHQTRQKQGTVWAAYDAIYTTNTAKNIKQNKEGTLWTRFDAILRVWSLSGVRMPKHSLIHPT